MNLLVIMHVVSAGKRLIIFQMVGIKGLFRLRMRIPGGMTGLCLEIHDLIAGEYVSSREKDLQFAHLVIEHHMVSEATLLKRVEYLQVDAAVKEKIWQRLIADFERAKPGQTQRVK